MNIGTRIIYDQDGEIIYRAGEIQGDVLPRKEITELHYIDLEYGAIDYHTHRIVSIDPATKQPVLEELPIVETPEQQKIKELEEQILLLANENTGGIL
ncbi:hypothetical protein [Paenibacillus sp. FSL K6-0108]|uniref:hypothetical protein n=1 Tax=Paenibacillus sp. FSL K6-0108 TaxID=2921417 RepID=UPI00324913E1